MNLAVKSKKKMRKASKDRLITIKKSQNDDVILLWHLELEHRAILDSIGEAMHVVDRDLQFVLFNKVFKQWNRKLGLKTKVMGRKINEIFPFISVNTIRQYEKVFRRAKTIITQERTKIRNREIFTETRKIPIIKQGKVIQVVTMVNDITERRKTEQQFIEQGNFLKRAIESLTHPFYVIDANDYTVNMANSAARMGCLTKKTTCYSVTHKRRNPCSDDGHPCTLDRVKKSSQPVTVEHTHYDKDGNVRHVEVHGYPVFNDKGEVYQMIEYCLDITQRKQAEEGLLSEKRFSESVINSTPGLFYIFDEDGNIIRWNRNLEAVTGYLPSEIKNMNPDDFFEGEGKKFARDVIKKVFLEGRASVELELVLKDKTRVPYFFTGERIFIEKKTYLVGMAMDITRLKQAEHVLRDSESRYHSLFENSPISLWEEDFSNIKTFIDSLRVKGIKDFRKYFNDNPQALHLCATMIKVISVNKAALKLYEAPNEKSLKRNLRMIFCRESYEMFKEELIAISEGKTMFECETITKTLKGKMINTYIKWTIPPGYEDTLSKVFVSIIDITKRTEIQHELELVNRELFKANRRLSRLALRDSHTGAYNHLYLEEALDREFSRARRYAHPLSVIMLDIDYFKSINDVYGHQFGDLILKQFTRQLKKAVRASDTVIRFGGEEFIILSPGQDMSTVSIMGQRLMDSVGLYNFGDKKHSVKLKLSAAVASYPEDKITKGIDLVDLADKILLKAKEDGGGRIYSYFDIANGASILPGRYDQTKDVSVLKGKIDKLTKRSNQSLMEAVFAFAKTIELKDHYTGKHVESTVDYAAKIANALKLSRPEIELVKQSSALHDLGKIGISEKILLKKSKLTKKEFLAIKAHPQIAADIIRPIHFLHSMIPLILYHHECWDGTGYPGGLRGEQIPLGARIIAIADVYQALISDRPYRAAYSKDEAIVIIKDGSGTQFDPNIVNIFLSIINKENQSEAKKYPPKTAV